MDNIRVHFNLYTNRSGIFVSKAADKVIPGWALPRQGDIVRLDDSRPYKVDDVIIQYQSGLGDSLNPTLVEVRLS